MTSGYLLIGFSVIGSLAGIYYLVNKKPDRAKPLDNTTKVNVAIQIGLSFWRIGVFLPPTAFVSSMKKALVKNIASLKSVWKNDREVLFRLYSTISVPQRKAFVKTLTEEMRQSLEIYFEKDEFYMACVTGFDPYCLAYLNNEEAAAARAELTAASGDNTAANELKPASTPTVGREPIDQSAQAADAKRAEGVRRRNAKKPSGSLRDGTVPASKSEGQEHSYMYLSRYFEELERLLNEFDPVEVFVVDLPDELDPAVTSAEDSVEESPKTKALKAELKDFLTTVRSLVVVMFLHQFMKRYPVDPLENGDPDSLLYKLFGNKTARVMKALRYSVGSGVVVVLAMVVLQHFGVLDEIFWGMTGNK